MTLFKHQEPAYLEMPGGTDWIYTVTSTNQAGNYKFKFFVDVYIGRLGTTYIVRLFFSPNAQGTGIINMSDIYEQYVASTNLGNADPGSESAFKGVDNVVGSECPIHCIDKYSLNNFNYAKVTLGWGQEYALNPEDAPTQHIFQATSFGESFTNSMTYNNEQIRTIGTSLTGKNEYGINWANWESNNYIMFSATSKFLTDAPNWISSKPQHNQQLIRQGDYCTLAFLNGTFTSGNSWVSSYKVVWQEADGTYISQNIVNNVASNGGYNANGDAAPIVDSHTGLIYIGVGLANLMEATGPIPALAGKYFITLLDAGGAACSESKGYKIQSDDCKGFETIRLTWLNKYGVWDYYNFTKKNIRSTEIKRTTYSKIKGEWNELNYVKDGYNRGNSTLNTMANEKITLNSDWFSSDNEAAWLEQLFISPEVYILSQGDDSAPPAQYGKYVQPVEITNKKYIKYTEANDKVSQYEVEIKYSTNKRVQRA